MTSPSRFSDGVSLSGLLAPRAVRKRDSRTPRRAEGPDDLIRAIIGRNPMRR